LSDIERTRLPVNFIVPPPLGPESYRRVHECPLCNWRRSLKLRYQLGRLLNVMFLQDDSLRMLLLTLTEPNSLGQRLGGYYRRLPS
jgi:hypothetical protein